MKCYYVTPIRTTYDRDTMVSPLTDINDEEPEPVVENDPTKSK